MKAKDLETAKKYFQPIFKEEKLPSKTATWRADFTENEWAEYSTLWMKDDMVKQNNIVVNDNSALYYFEGFLALSIGHSRRGQHYYILCEIETLNVYIFATNPDGGGGIIDFPEIIYKMIANGELIL